MTNVMTRTMEVAYMMVPLAPCKNMSMLDQWLTILLQNPTFRRDRQLKPRAPFSVITATAMGL
eukprot:504718-Karenia_brevis.AAC.1